MVAITSTTTAFTMDVDDIIQKAYKPLGGEFVSAEDASNARLSLNLILIELQNKNIPLNKIDTVEVALTDGTQEYVLDASIVDVLELTLKDANDTEIPLTRYSLREFHEITKKELESRPTCFAAERLNSAVTVKFWPIPDLSTYSMNLLVYKRIEDVTASYQRIDLPHRYLPLIVKWLSYSLSLDKPNVAIDKRQELKQNYLETYDSTVEEDRERTDFNITPGGVSGF